MKILVLGDKQLITSIAREGYKVTSDPGDDIICTLSDTTSFRMAPEDVPLVVLLSNNISDWVVKQDKPHATFVNSLSEAIDKIKVLELEANRQMEQTEAGMSPLKDSVVVATFANKGGTGKTTSAINIAITMAQKEVSTALCAFDYGGKSLESFFNVPLNQTNYLEHITDANIQQFMIKVNNHLWILPSPADINPTHVSSQVSERIIQLLKNKFQVIVCDTSPQPWEKQYLYGVFKCTDLVYAVVNQSKYSMAENSLYAPRLLLMGATPGQIRIIVNQYDPKLVNLKKVEKTFSSGFKKGVKDLPTISAVIPNNWVEQNYAVNRGEISNEEVWLRICKEILQRLGIEGKQEIETQKKTGFHLFGKSVVQWIKP